MAEWTEIKRRKEKNREKHLNLFEIKIVYTRDFLFIRFEREW